jgi:hypothetical protein
MFYDYCKQKGHRIEGGQRETQPRVTYKAAFCKNPNLHQLTSQLFGTSSVAPKWFASDPAKIDKWINVSWKSGRREQN